MTSLERKKLCFSRITSVNGNTLFCTLYINFFKKKRKEKKYFLFQHFENTAKVLHKSIMTNDADCKYANNDVNPRSRSVKCQHTNTQDVKKTMKI